MPFEIDYGSKVPMGFAAESSAPPETSSRRTTASSAMLLTITTTRKPGPLPGTRWHRFVEKEALYRVHECVFGVLALASAPVDLRP